MANRSDRGREQPAVMSRASKPAKQNGTSSAETIRASGHDRANRPYTRLHPTNAPTLTNPLQRGSHPHRTSGELAQVSRISPTNHTTPPLGAGAPGRTLVRRRKALA